MVLGSILNPVNSSMIAVALVPIGVALHAQPAATAWLVSGLYLATATGQPVVGKLVDRYGPRALYLAGSALVGIAGIIGLLAPTLGVLVVSRVLLGLGTCAGFPAAMYLIRRESERTGLDSPRGVLTTLSVSAQTIVVIGPSLGGLLIGVAGWRAIFAVNIPLAVACIILALVRLPRPARPATREPLDHLGIGLFAGMLTALMLFLMSPSIGELWLLAVTVACGAAFGWRELRITEPFLDLRVFGGNAPLIATYGRALLAQTAAYAYLYGFTQWLEAGRGLNATHAGLLLLPMSLLAIGVSTVSGRRPGFRAKLLVGATAQLVVSVLMLVLNAGSPVWLLVLISAVCSLPQGLNSLANQNALYYQADPARIGASAGLLRTFSYLGAMVSSAATGVFFAHGADTAGLHSLAGFLIVVAALLIIMVAADRSLSGLGRGTSPAPSARV
ncbi:MFS transporter [Actinoplanes bogorensis]|uniref:MFS transporter n=2 Tax=Paractinoplanes bogorensis TaxID=1610840 RepID=A0ABS5YGA0_9ACTN|nr:MFS transporter [Actinoplanes bogorensis]